MCDNLLPGEACFAHEAVMILLAWSVTQLSATRLYAFWVWGALAESALADIGSQQYEDHDFDLTMLV